MCEVTWEKFHPWTHLDGSHLASPRWLLPSCNHKGTRQGASVGPERFLPSPSLLPTPGSPCSSSSMETSVLPHNLKKNIWVKTADGRKQEEAHHGNIYFGKSSRSCMPHCSALWHRQAGTWGLRPLPRPQNTMCMPVMHRYLVRPLAGSQPAKVSMGIWTALGSFWVWELVKFHQTQDTVWEQGGLSEGENSAPEGSKTTKNKNVFV